tara:strand:- start:20 stop:334 length:315 start_codon:yes stop_codon:yes gene_type:complete
MAQKEQKVAEEVVEQTATPETAGGEAVVESISLVDLSSLAQIIDLASSRGAFRGAELEPVGALFNKLTAFLNSVKQAQEEAAGTNEGQADGTDAEAPVEASAGE